MDQKNKKPMKDWSREEMESWLRGTHGAVISEDGEVLNKMSKEGEIHFSRLKCHGRNGNVDAYNITGMTAKQIDDMLEFVEAGTELGYTLLDGVQTKEEWIAQMRGLIGQSLKEATGYTDAEVDELLEDLWNAPYELDGKEKTVAQWAEEKGITINNKNDNARNKEMVLVALEHPEATLWAVVPKEEWEKTPPTTRGVLELVEKQVSGQSFQEAIEEMEEADRFLERDSLQEQLQRLESVLKNVEIKVEPATEESESMTVEELNQAENSLLYPEPALVWDSPNG